MTPFLQLMLVSHVLFGIVGTIALYATWLGLLKREIVVASLQRSSIWSFVMLLLSWLTGGYYYVTYYGAAVRQVIKAGPYPWAHTVMMEAKEHIFLFLPFLAVVIAAVVLLLKDHLGKDKKLRRSLSWLSGVAASIAMIVTLFGVFVSGAVR